MNRPRILIADDVLVAEALGRLIEPEYLVVKVVSDPSGLLSAAVEMNPDVVLMDMNMSLRSDFDAGTELKRLLPGTKLILLATNDDPVIASKALRRWSAGYLLKSSADAELKRAIRDVLSGHSYMTASIVEKLIDEFVRIPQQTRPKELTKRQRQVVQLLAEGLSMKEAAEVLSIAVRTVAFHKYRIMDDFGLKTNSDLIRFAMREHLISDV